MYDYLATLKSNYVSSLYNAIIESNFKDETTFSADIVSIHNKEFLMGLLPVYIGGQIEKDIKARLMEVWNKPNIHSSFGGRVVLKSTIHDKTKEVAGMVTESFNVILTELVCGREENKLFKAYLMFHDKNGKYYTDVYTTACIYATSSNNVREYIESVYSPLYKPDVRLDIVAIQEVLSSDQTTEEFYR